MVYKKLTYQPLIRDPGDCRVIGGNGEPLDLKGFTVLPVTLGTTLLWHEFGVVPNLPLEVLIGADVLTNHQSSLLYLTDNQKRLTFGNENCKECDRFRTNPEVGASAQLKFVEWNPKRRRNHCKIGANFVATLPEADGYEKNEIEFKPDIVQLKPGSVLLEPDTVDQKPNIEIKPDRRTTDGKTSKGAGRPASSNTADTGANAQATGGGCKGKPRCIRGITHRFGKNLSSGAYDQD